MLYRETNGQNTAVAIEGNTSSNLNDFCFAAMIASTNGSLPEQATLHFQMTLQSSNEEKIWFISIKEVYELLFTRFASNHKRDCHYMLFFFKLSWATEAEGYEKLPDWCFELLDFYHARTEWSYSLVMAGMITSQDGCNATFQGLGA